MDSRRQFALTMDPKSIELVLHIVDYSTFVRKSVTILLVVASKPPSKAHLKAFLK